MAPVQATVKRSQKMRKIPMEVLRVRAQQRQQRRKLMLRTVKQEQMIQPRKGKSIGINRFSLI